MLDSDKVVVASLVEFKCQFGGDDIVGGTNNRRDIRYQLFVVTYSMEGPDFSHTNLSFDLSVGGSIKSTVFTVRLANRRRLI